MTTYKVTQFFTPDDPRSPRDVRCVLFEFDKPNGRQNPWFEIFYAGLDAIGYRSPRHVLDESDLRDQLGNDSEKADLIEIRDTEENRRHVWEIQVWESKPTTKAEIWSWAEEVSRLAADPRLEYTALVVLRELLGRRIWDRLDQEDGAFELKQELHDLYYNGFTGKAIVEMNKDELLTQVMEEIVTPEEENYNLDTEKVPCSFEWVLNQRRYLWLNESLA